MHCGARTPPTPRHQGLAADPKAEEKRRRKRFSEVGMQLGPRRFDGAFRLFPVGFCFLVFLWCLGLVVYLFQKFWSFCWIEVVRVVLYYVCFCLFCGVVGCGFPCFDGFCDSESTIPPGNDRKPSALGEAWKP